MVQYTFLVSVSDPIVQMDLQGALVGYFPQSLVIPVAHQKDILAQMNESPFPVCVMFSNTEWSDETRDVLLGVVENGGRVVTIGPPRIDGIPAAVLNVPFSTEMLLDVLSNDVADDQASQASAGQ